MQIKPRWDRQLIFFSLIAILFLSGALPMEAAENLQDKIQDFQQEQEQLKDEMEQLEEEVDQLEEKATETEIRIQEISREIDQQIQELERLDGEIEETEAEIKATQAELEAAEEELAEKEEFLGTRMRASYQQGSINYLEVLFEAEDFIDFLSRLNYIQAIVDKDMELIAEVEKQRDQIQAHKEDLEDQKEHLKSLYAEAEAKRQEMEQNRQAQERLHAELMEQKQLKEESLNEKEQEAEQIQERIVELQRQDGVGVSGQLAWPVEDFGPGYITSPFGYRNHPVYGGRRFHSGIDIGIPRSRWPGSHHFNGNPVNIRAAESGVIMFAGIQGSLNSGYGRVIIVDHGQGYSTVYAHARDILVSEGQEVSRGEPIGIVGSTGLSTGPHLHFEVLKNGSPQNPMEYLR